ncbi:MAG: anaerobic ribonucleoside-triphosphate reductase [Candidatus Helarchaeota archaeon]
MDKSNNIVSSQKILSAISNDVRAEILKLLSRKNPLSFTEIMEERGLNPSQDAGRFGYHLRELRKARLIKGGPEEGYQLTTIGEKVVEFLWTLIDIERVDSYIPVRTSGYTIEHFDKTKIIQSLTKEASVPEDLAKEIANETEERLFKANIKYLTAPLIREAVNFILIEKGYEDYRHSLTRLGLPPYDITVMLNREKSINENFNPETVHKIAGDAVMEQYLLLNILDHKVADGYLSGEFYIPNANYFILRVNSLHHDIRWFLKDGLKYDYNKNNLLIHKPKDLAGAFNLIFHLLNLSQIFVSGNQVIDSFNIFLLPFIKNLDEKKIKKSLLTFYTDISNSFSSRGGQLISADLQFDLEIPPFFNNLNIDEIDNSVSKTYSDYDDQLDKILEINLEILYEGVNKKSPVSTPRQIFKINKELLNNLNHKPILEYLIKVVRKWGEINFINTSPTWQNENVSYTDSLERIENRWLKDLNNDYTACGNLDWVILNMPRIAIESKKIIPKFYNLINERIEKCLVALQEKINVIRKNIFDYRNLPFFNYLVNNKYYFNIAKSTISISYLGIFECANIFLSPEADFNDKLKFVEEVLKYMNDLINEKNETFNYNLNLRQAISGKWSENLVKLDKLKFEKDDAFTDYKNFQKYHESNFINSNLSIKEIIKYESKFQKLLKGGHRLIVPICNEDIDELFNLLKWICQKDIGYFKFVKKCP